MADLLYTNEPNIVVTLSDAFPVDIGTQKNLAFGEVYSMYLNCYLYAVGDIVLFDKEKAVRYTLSSIVYFVISTDSVKLVYRVGAVS